MNVILEFINRLRLACRVLLGQARAANDVLCCGRHHLAGDEAAVKKVELRALEDAADELKVARGAISQVDDGKYERYVRTVKETVEGRGR